jgi:hypothetical protein
MNRVSVETTVHPLADAFSRLFKAALNLALRQCALACR